MANRLDQIIGQPPTPQDEGADLRMIQSQLRFFQLALALRENIDRMSQDRGVLGGKHLLEDEDTQIAQQGRHHVVFGIGPAQFDGQFASGHRTGHRCLPPVVQANVGAGLKTHRRQRQAQYQRAHRLEAEEVQRAIDRADRGAEARTAPN